MTPEKEQEFQKTAIEMVSNPALSQFIFDLPDGKKAMQIECVVAILMSMLGEMDGVMEQVVGLIKDAGDDLKGGPQ